MSRLTQCNIKYSTCPARFVTERVKTVLTIRTKSSSDVYILDCEMFQKLKTKVRRHWYNNDLKLDEREREREEHIKLDKREREIEKHMHVEKIIN